MKRLRLKTIIILIIFFVLVIMYYYINKFFIISKIELSIDKLNMIANYMIETDNGTVYRKGDKYLIKQDNNNIYINNLTHISYIINEETKKYSVIYNTANYEEYTMGLLNEKITIKNKIKDSFSWKIKNDEKCFHIYKDNEEFWIDKESFLVVKKKDGQKINNIYIELNCVTDEIINPNLDNYILEGKNND